MCYTFGKMTDLRAKGLIAVQKALQIGGEHALQLFGGHAQCLCHARDDGSDGQGAFVGFGKDLAKRHLAQCFGIEMLTERNEKSRLHQGLHHMRIAPKSVYGARHTALAPHGRIMPLPVTGSPSSDEDTLPPSLGFTTAPKIYSITDGESPVV